MHTGALNFQGAFSNTPQDAEWCLEVAAISHSPLFVSTSFNPCDTIRISASLIVTQKLATLRSGEDLSNADSGKDLSIADSGLKILATLRSGEDLSIAAIEKLATHNNYHKQHLQTKNT